MLRDIKEDLGPNMKYAGKGRTKNRNGEHCRIFWNDARFELLKKKDFSLSNSPSKFGKKSWGSRCPRMATWVRLRDRKTSSNLCVLNTHLDHSTTDIRTKQVQVILTKLSELVLDNELLLFAGDFNEDSNIGNVHAECMKWGFIDPGANITEQTFHGFLGSWEDCKGISNRFSMKGIGPIDWILLKNAEKLSYSISVLKYSLMGADGVHRYPSDHYPVALDLIFDDKERIKSCPDEKES